MTAEDIARALSGKRSGRQWLCRCRCPSAFHLHAFHADFARALGYSSPLRPSTCDGVALNTRSARPESALTLRIFNDGRLAEIVLDRSATTKHVLDAMDLVRLLLAHGVTSAKIIRTQTAQESPPPRFVT